MPMHSLGPARPGHPDGLALGDGAQAASFPGSRDDGLEIGIVEGAHDHAQAEPGQAVGGRQQLPVPEVAGQEEDAPALGQCLSDVLGPMAPDAAQQVLGRAEEESAAFHRSDAEVLKAPARESRTARGREVSP
jgi:hypothetical protein